MDQLYQEHHFQRQQLVAYAMQFVQPLLLANSLLHHIHWYVKIVCLLKLLLVFEWLLLKYYSMAVGLLMYFPRFVYESGASLLWDQLRRALSSFLPTCVLPHGTWPLLQINYYVH